MRIRGSDRKLSTSQIAKGRWDDLKSRTLSAALMLGVGSVIIWEGSPLFIYGIIALVALMFWELSSMTTSKSTHKERPSNTINKLLSLLTGCLAAVSFSGAVFFITPYAALFLLLAPLLCAVVAGQQKLICVGYGVFLMIACVGLIGVRLQSLDLFLWLVCVVIMSDVAGYFIGRRLGGPKFWPRISPKKTWSGTVAGWLVAVFISWIFVLFGVGGWKMVLLAPFLSFAGQLGDIAESAIKRRVGVKDSSHLIPGHGGVLDRFDALLGAAAFLMLIDFFGLFPTFGFPDVSLWVVGG